MDELVKMVAQKCNIPESVAKTAVELVIGWLKTKLPAPLAGQLDTVLKGGTVEMGNASQGLGGMLKGLLGRK